MTNRCFALLLIVLLAGSGIVFSQSNSGVEQLYSSGVHAFNSQRYAEAIDWFNRLETNGVQDPRAFFFRGLAQSRLGHAEAANSDFATAATMELTVAGRSYSVPKALERIQGRERTAIEQHRRAAKHAWEADENLRRQEEFLAQKAENQKFYQTIIVSGENALPAAADFSTANLALPFGAQSATPFGQNKAASQSNVVAGITPGGLTEGNIFKEDVERVTVIDEPPPPPPRQTRQQDPNERGVFDNLSDDDEVGFDASALLQGNSSTAPRSRTDSGFGTQSFGGRDDDFFTTDDDFGAGPDTGQGGFGLENMPFGTAPTGGNTDPVKDGGRSFGKGFASLFKKSGVADSTPSTTVTTPDDSDDEDPFNTEF